MYKQLILFLHTGVMLFLLQFCSSQKAPQVPEDLKMKLANTYYNNGLHEAAIAEYRDYLEKYDVDPGRQANTYYTIANIYLERLNNYDKALEYYFKVKYLFPESPVISDVNKRIVSCLERMQRSKDAARIYEQSAALDQKSVKEERPGSVLAEIGDKKITQGDLDFQISRLPVVVQNELNKSGKKKEFLRQMVLQDLLYDSAKRQGLEKDSEVIEGTFQAQKTLMAEKILRTEIQKNVSMTSEDVELYFKANRERYAEKDEQGKIVRQRELSEAAQEAARDLAMERQQKATSELLDRLMKAENVKLYEARIK